MYTKVSTPRILLISLPDHAECLVRETLRKTSYEIIEAKNSQAGIQKTIEYVPDLVICQNELDGYNGFQLYNLLKDTLIRHGILFFIYSDKLDKEDILIGLEMGVNNFIISPVDEKTLVEKIERQIHKIKDLKKQEEKNFNSYFHNTPVAKFVVVNNRIEKANQAFLRLMQLPETEIEQLVTEIFDFSQDNENAMNFRKCTNGFLTACRLNNVPSHRHLTQRFDIHFHYNSLNGKGQLWGEVVPQNNANDFNNEMQPEQYSAAHNGNGNGNRNNGRLYNALGVEVNLTRREKEVLKHSALGYSIKQIAELLDVSQRTVEKHRANIMQKTKTNNIVEAIYVVSNSNRSKFSFSN